MCETDMESTLKGGFARLNRVRGKGTDDCSKEKLIQRLFPNFGRWKATIRYL